jgi:uncharacterized membrane protein YkvA (DUF1232 family)
MFKRTFATHFGTHGADVGAGVDGVGIDLGDNEKAAHEEARVRREFWSKFRRFAARLPFAEDLVAAYFCAFDRNTPRKVQVALIGALAYFVLPFDFIPDMLPLIGFADDAAVLATAMRLVSAHIGPQHREAARRVICSCRPRPRIQRSGPRQTGGLMRPSP